MASQSLLVGDAFANVTLTGAPLAYSGASVDTGSARTLNASLCAEGV